MAASPDIQPVFDPRSVGASLDIIRAMIPLNAEWLKGVLPGEWLAPQKGVGFDMYGIRDFETGDSPSDIDWRIAARRDEDAELPLREDYREVTPNVHILTDMLQSRNHISADQDNPGYFSEQLLAMSAVVAFMRIAEANAMPWTLTASGDKVIEIEDKAASFSPGHVRLSANRIARKILDQEGRLGEVADYRLKTFLEAAAKKYKQNVIVIVSDFRDEKPDDNGEDGPQSYGGNPDWLEPLLELSRKNGNEVIGVETIYPFDERIPKEDERFVFGGFELYTGHGRKGGQSKENAAAILEAQQEMIDRSLARAKVKHIKLRTTESNWLNSLKAQLQPSARRKAAKHKLIKT